MLSEHDNVGIKAKEKCAVLYTVSYFSSFMKNMSDPEM